MPQPPHTDSPARRATPRERARVQTMADIVRIGRMELAQHGAAALSLRAVARELGVVSSALYRYIPSRDALLTLLIEDAYAEMGAAVAEAEAAAARTDYRGRFGATARGVRDWALREPARYGLLYGSPVPGYAAPAERTTEPGTRVIRQLVAIVTEAEAAGAVTTPAAPGPLSPALRADAAAIRAELDVAVSDELLTRAVLAWVALFGAVSFEVFGQYGEETFAAPAELFEHQVSMLASLIGL
ncbi:TetR/AcrR family transcriptional regulator [Tomitella biformata]|uniref:TetR/AcrR family transcriptional regulator n=1 Tax=Tomitella biformata TaxID=630403 RepID=UPI000467915C|nr:TetR/AcrR family transcriptional regulator [Tomitella biformata]